MNEKFIAIIAKNNNMSICVEEIKSRKSVVYGHGCFFGYHHHHQRHISGSIESTPTCIMRRRRCKNQLPPWIALSIDRPRSVMPAASLPFMNLCTYHHRVLVCCAGWCSKTWAQCDAPLCATCDRTIASRSATSTGCAADNSPSR